MSLPFYECVFCRRRLVDCDGSCTRNVEHVVLESPPLTLAQDETGGNPYNMRGARVTDRAKPPIRRNPSR